MRKMRRISLAIFLVLAFAFSGNVFAKERKRVLQLERSRDGMFRGEIRNAKLKDIAAVLSSKTGPKVEVHESIKDKLVKIRYKFKQVNITNLLKTITYPEQYQLKYRKVKGENKFIIEPIEVNKSSEMITEEDLVYYYDTTVVNPEPKNTKQIVIKNGRVISGKLIPTWKRDIGEKWIVIKDDKKHNKTVEEIIPGKKIELINTNKYGHNNEYGSTIVSLSETFREKFEPFASPISKRIQALKKLHDRGLKTWISMEPYPTPNIVQQDIYDVLEAVSFVDKIVFGKWNYSKLVGSFDGAKDFYNEASQKVLEFCTKKGIEVHIKAGTITSNDVPKKSAQVFYEPEQKALFGNIA